MIFLGCSNKQTTKVFINEAVAMKFYHQLLEKRDAGAVFWIIPGKQMTNNYSPCFNIINYVIPSYI